MKNHLAAKILEAKRKGVEQGLFLMSNICLIALENAITSNNLQVSDTFFSEVEADMRNIFNEIVGSVPSGDVSDMGERIAYYVDSIRNRRGMDA